MGMKMGEEKRKEKQNGEIELIWKNMEGGNRLVKVKDGVRVLQYCILITCIWYYAMSKKLKKYNVISK